MTRLGGNYNNCALLKAGLISCNALKMVVVGSVSSPLSSSLLSADCELLGHIASVIFREAAKTQDPVQQNEPSVVIMCTPCGKGAYGLRAGAHLVNHGASCVAYLPMPTTSSGGDQQLPPNFEAHLRLYSAAGGRVLRSVDGMSSSSSFF